MRPAREGRENTTKPPDAAADVEASMRPAREGRENARLAPYPPIGARLQ